MAKNTAKVPVYKQNALKSKEAAIKKQAEDEAAKIIADAKARAQEIKENTPNCNEVGYTERDRDGVVDVQVHKVMDPFHEKKEVVPLHAQPKKRVSCDRRKTNGAATEKPELWFLSRAARNRPSLTHFASLHQGAGRLKFRISTRTCRPLLSPALSLRPTRPRVTAVTLWSAPSPAWCCLPQTVLFVADARCKEAASSAQSMVSGRETRGTPAASVCVGGGTPCA